MKTVKLWIFHLCLIWFFTQTSISFLASAIRRSPDRLAWSFRCRLRQIPAFPCPHSSASDFDSQTQDSSDSSDDFSDDFLWSFAWDHAQLSTQLVIPASRGSAARCTADARPAAATAAGWRFPPPRRGSAWQPRKCSTGSSCLWRYHDHQEQLHQSLSKLHWIFLYWLSPKCSK